MFLSKSFIVCSVAVISCALAASPPAALKSHMIKRSEPSHLIGTQTGDGTAFEVGLGACGIVNKNTDLIAAVGHGLLDTFPGYSLDGNPNNNPVCGKRIKANYQGNSVTVSITDRYTACQLTDQDFSPSTFRKLAPLSEGRIHGVKGAWL